MHKQPKILFFDLETLPNIVATWGVWKQNVPADFILKERSIISGQYKFLGEDEVSVISIGDRPRKFKINPHDDSYVVKELYKILLKADIIVGHNTDKFDIKYFNTRAIYHGLPPLPSIPTVDTLKEARKKFRFNFNRLDYLGDFLNLDRKLPTSANLWVQILKGDQNALQHMIDYGKQDIILLEKVYLELLPYMTTHPNLNLLENTDIPLCPKCGSMNLIRNGTRRTKTNTYIRYQCKDCGGWSQGGSSIGRSDIR